MRIEVDRFRARADDGATFTVIERQNYRKYKGRVGGVQWLPSTKDFMLSDGRDVSFVEPETFRIVESDRIIRKV
jgi:hypothetical protein